MSQTSDALFEYLREIFYATGDAELDVGKLEEDYQMLGKGLAYFAQCFHQYNEFAKALAKGDLSAPPPPPENELAAPLKSLHASLKHLTWQTQQVAKGDYKQHVDFMGEFAEGFNKMVAQLADRQKKLEDEISQSKEHANALEEQAYKDALTHVYNRFYGMYALNRWIEEKRKFALTFIDMDSLKYVNDVYGHTEGDEYIRRVSGHLEKFSPRAVVCRLGGDEFMLLEPEMGYDEAAGRMVEIQEAIQNDPYLEGKEFGYSISVGTVAVDASNKLSSSDILSIADERMYEHKKARKKERQNAKKTKEES